MFDFLEKPMESIGKAIEETTKLQWVLWTIGVLLILFLAFLFFFAIKHVAKGDEVKILGLMDLKPHSYVAEQRELIEKLKGLSRFLCKLIKGICYIRKWCFFKNALL